MTPWIDPQMAAILARLKKLPAIDFKTMPIAEARPLNDAGSIPWSEGAPAMETRALTIPATDRAMRARLYLPAGDAFDTLAIFVHGGGWTFGSIDTHDGTMRNLAAALRAPVLGFDYRLAPEHPFPAPLDDALAAIAFVEAGGLGAPHRGGTHRARRRFGRRQSRPRRADRAARRGPAELARGGALLRLLRAGFFDREPCCLRRRRLSPDQPSTCAGTGRTSSAAPPTTRRASPRPLRSRPRRPAAALSRRRRPRSAARRHARCWRSGLRRAGVALSLRPFSRHRARLAAHDAGTSCARAA